MDWNLHAEPPIGKMRATRFRWPIVGPTSSVIQATDNTTANYEVETKRPSASSFTFSWGSTVFNYPAGSSIPALKPGDNATVTLVFSEVVTGFDSDDDITDPHVDARGNDT